MILPLITMRILPLSFHDPYSPPTPWALTDHSENRWRQKHTSTRLNSKNFVQSSVNAVRWRNEKLSDWMSPRIWGSDRNWEIDCIDKLGLQCKDILLL